MKLPSQTRMLVSVRNRLSLLSGVGKKCLSLCLALILTTFTLLGFNCNSAVAADKILLIYGTGRENLTLNELQQFTRTGTQPDVFSTLGVSQQDASDLRTLLNQEIPVSREFLEKILKSGIGQYILTRLDPVIGQEGVQEGVEDVAQALLEASDDGTLSLLEVMRYYPQQQIVVNGPLLQDAYNRISFIAEDVRPVIEVVTNFMADLVCEGNVGSAFDAPSLNAFNRASRSNFGL